MMRVIRKAADTLSQLTLVQRFAIVSFFVLIIGAFIIGRFVYRNAYVKDPENRSSGFLIGALPMMVAMIGGVIGAVVAMVQS